MNNSIQNYKHLVNVDKEKLRIEISRIFPSGKQSLYTYVEIPNEAMKHDKQYLQEFARLLGENILLDSPIARELLGL